MTGGPASPRIVPFRGRYHALSAEASGLVRGLVYPVPDPSFPFLGVHFTKQISGEVWTGPNAVLALAREGYRGWEVDRRDLWETLSYSGFRILARRYWRTGLSEVRGDLSRHTFVRALQRLVPSVRLEHLAGTHAGVRAQALSSDGTTPGRLLVRPRGQGASPPERPLACGDVEPGARQGGRRCRGGVLHGRVTSAGAAC